LAALAWLLADVHWDRSSSAWPRPGPHAAAAIVLGIGAVAGLIPPTVFSDGGDQPYSLTSFRDFVALTPFVLVAAPRSRRAIQLGALLTIGLLAVAYAVPTPMGSNVLRLPMFFAIPVVAAYVPWRTWALVAALAGMFWWRPPIVSGDLKRAGAP